jgi:hypothetical protein
VPSSTREANVWARKATAEAEAAGIAAGAPPGLLGLLFCRG